MNESFPAFDGSDANRRTKTARCAANNRARRAQARSEAEARQAAHDALSLEERLAKAISRGHDGTREVKRLRELIEA